MAREQMTGAPSEGTLWLRTPEYPLDPKPSPPTPSPGALGRALKFPIEKGELGPGSRTNPCYLAAHWASRRLLPVAHQVLTPAGLHVFPLHPPHS